MKESKIDRTKEEIQYQSHNDKDPASKNSINTSQKQSHHLTLPNKQLEEDTLLNYYNGII